MMIAIVGLCLLSIFGTTYSACNYYESNGYKYPVGYCVSSRYEFIGITESSYMYECTENNTITQTSYNVIECQGTPASTFVYSNGTAGISIHCDQGETCGFHYRVYSNPDITADNCDFYSSTDPNITFSEVIGIAGDCEDFGDSSSKYSCSGTTGIKSVFYFDSGCTGTSISNTISDGECYVGDYYEVFDCTSSAYLLQASSLFIISWAIMWLFY